MMGLFSVKTAAESPQLSAREQAAAIEQKAEHLRIELRTLEDQYASAHAPAVLAKAALEGREVASSVVVRERMDIARSTLKGLAEARIALELQIRKDRVAELQAAYDIAHDENKLLYRKAEQLRVDSDAAIKAYVNSANGLEIPQKDIRAFRMVINEAEKHGVLPLNIRQEIVDRITQG
jgi:hypothetical protein